MAGKSKIITEHHPDKTTVVHYLETKFSIVNDANGRPQNIIDRATGEVLATTNGTWWEVVARDPEGLRTTSEFDLFMSTTATGAVVAAAIQ
jgi:hypothetical protein